MSEIKMFELFITKTIALGIVYEFEERSLVFEFLCFAFVISFKAKFGFNFINSLTK